ncbi:MAG: Uncharacterised protein [Cryomorphaceae bacterium]|nr:MAG: Uncharacterised protein [Cryomorphaceae bacterium]
MHLTFKIIWGFYITDTTTWATTTGTAATRTAACTDNVREVRLHVCPFLGGEDQIHTVDDVLLENHIIIGRETIIVRRALIVGNDNDFLARSKQGDAHQREYKCAEIFHDLVGFKGIFQSSTDNVTREGIGFEQLTFHPIKGRDASRF